VLLGLVALAVIVVVASNSGGGKGSDTAANTAPATPTTAATHAAAPASSAVPQDTCTLADDQHLIVRYIAPGVQDNAQELGETDASHCTPTLQWLEQTAANGPGDCTQVAWASDNPGYNADALPAPPLKKVIEAIGPGC
jgi:hypothetical protein